MRANELPTAQQLLARYRQLKAERAIVESPLLRVKLEFDDTRGNTIALIPPPGEDLETLRARGLAAYDARLAPVTSQLAALGVTDLDAAQSEA